MVETGTWMPPKLFHTIGTQTEAPSLRLVRHHASTYQQYLTDRRCLLASVKKLLATHLRMPGGPSATHATLQVTIPFHTIPLAGWKALFPQNTMEWHVDVKPQKVTSVGLIMDPWKVMSHSVLDLTARLEHAIGCCKAVVPPKGEVKSVLAYTPPFKLWHQAAKNGEMESILSANVCILDESGELRTPPNHVYTDAEELSIKTVMMEQVQKMADAEYPLSATFEAFLERWHAEGEEGGVMPQEVVVVGFVEGEEGGRMVPGD